jgi:hypothetical protein
MVGNNPSYLGGGGKRMASLRPAQANKVRETLAQKQNTNEKAGGHSLSGRPLVTSRRPWVQSVVLPAPPQKSPVAPFTFILFFYLRGWGLIQGPHACLARTLPLSYIPSPQPSSIYTQKPI